MTRKKVKCPHCGYEMPIEYDETGQAKGLFVRCKGKNCREEFEIIIESETENKIK